MATAPWADLEAALTAFLDHERLRFKVGDPQFIKVLRVLREGEAPAPDAVRVRKVPRLRSMSPAGVGRGKGRGAKEPAAKLIRPLKLTGPRAEFIRFIGAKTAALADIENQFTMTRANVNSYLTNINRDHGIGYDKDNSTVRLILPKGTDWRNVWDA